jgi:hypothetical protein
MRTAMLIAATLGIFGLATLTPVAASPTAGSDELAQIRFAQYQEAVDPWSTASSTKKKKPKKKQRYERSN